MAASVHAHLYVVSPNMHRLHPVMPHSQHTIINGMLLHPAGLKNDDGASDLAKNRAWSLTSQKLEHRVCATNKNVIIKCCGSRMFYPTQGTLPDDG